MIIIRVLEILFVLFIWSAPDLVKQRQIVKHFIKNVLY